MPTGQAWSVRYASIPPTYALVKLIGPVTRAVQDVVESRIDQLGSTGEAPP